MIWYYKMDLVNENEDWSKLAPEEKKRRLFLIQKALLDTFREHNAISQDQYDKSLGDLREKMGFLEVDINGET